MSFVAPEAVLDQLEAEGRVVLRYVQVAGADDPGNPNGSMRDIAGISNREGNVVGMMPHPERRPKRSWAPPRDTGSSSLLASAMSLTPDS